MKNCLNIKVPKLLTLSIIITFILGISYHSSGQVTLPHHDPIDYPVGQGLQAQNGWTILNSGDDLLITAGNLTYPGLVGSTGNKVTFDGAGIDAAKLFTQQTSGIVYQSFLLQITALGGLTTTGGYFAGFTEGTSTSFGGTVWTRLSGTGYNIGVNVRSTAANTVWTTETFALNTTVLVVVAYELVSGTANDIARLWVNPLPGSTLPAATISATNSGGTDLLNVNRILVRQAVVAETPFIEMDELRIGTNWSDVTPAGGPVPDLTVWPNTLSGFVYAIGSGPSTSQSYNISGVNLTGAPGNISISSSANFEVSTNNTNFSNNVLIPYTSATLASTTVYVRLKAGLSIGSYTNENISNSGGGSAQKTVYCSGSVIAVVFEPSNHPTNFTAATNTGSSITLAWTDANPAASAYLIKGSTASFTSIVAPTDGSSTADGGLNKNVASGVQTHTFTGLPSSTAHYFKVYPYNGTGLNINYKTDGEVPQTAATTFDANVNTYSWIGDNNAAWTTASNWLPSRNTAQVSDVLIFNDGNSKTITAVPTQTIGKLFVSNSTALTLQAATNSTLSISSGSGNDFIVEAGAQLNLSGPNPLTIALNTGSYGVVNGSVSLSGGSHRLTAGSVNGITFNNGSICTAGTAFSGNAFGTGLGNSVIFANGSTYIHQSGLSPFALSLPLSVVVFQSGSTYIQAVNANISLVGRTYANLEINATDFNQSMTGNSRCEIENLTITNAQFAGFNLTGGIVIKGNLNVYNGTLSFAPAVASSVLFFGPNSQTISGTGQLEFSSNANVGIDNNIVVNKNISFGGNVTVFSDRSLTINQLANVTVLGNLDNRAGVNGLRIRSDETGNGSLIHNTVNVAATVERYITGNSNLTVNAYHLVSVPLNAAVTAGQFLNSYLMRFNTTSQAWESVGASTSIPLPVNQGYMIYYPNSYTTYQFTGQLNSGNFTAATPVVAADQFSLVPNPYPSAIDWDASGWVKTNLRDAIWIWNPAANNYAAYGSEIGVNGATRYIPSGQAFFVKSNAPAPVLGLSNAVRVHNTQPFFKNAGNLKDQLRLRVNCNGFNDEIVLRYNGDASLSLDEKDVDKLFGGLSAPQLYSLTNEGRKLSINTFPYASSNQIIPLGFEIQTNAAATITTSGLETFNSSLAIYLEDKLENKMINLRETATYTFNHSSNNLAQRFNIHFMGVTSATELHPKAKSNESYVWQNNNLLNIVVPGIEGNQATVSIFDAMGRKIQSETLILNQISTMEIGKHKGVIFVRITAGNKFYGHKLVIR